MAGTLKARLHHDLTGERLHAPGLDDLLRVDLSARLQRHRDVLLVQSLCRCDGCGSGGDGALQVLPGCRVCDLRLVP